MKHLVLLVALVAVFPASRLCRNRELAYFLLLRSIGFLPFTTIDLNIVSFEFYRGDSRGIEVTLLDLAVLTLFASLPTSMQAASSPFSKARWAFFTACALSAAFSTSPLFSLFSLWKLLRMFFVAHVVARAAMDPRGAAALLSGLAMGVLYEFTLAFEQRYLYGMVRVSGNLSHPNSLGMALNMVFPVSLALLLVGQGGRLAVLTATCAAAGVVMSLSRGAMAMYGIATAIVFAGSLARGITSRKLVVVGITILGVVGLAVKALDTVIERFKTASDASEEARILFEHAASMMVKEHPWGIGVNQFSQVLAGQGYADRAGIPEVDRDGIVHNIYWLTTAETGYFGLACYLVLLAAPLVIAIRGAVRFRNDPRGDILLGFAAGLTVTYIQGKAEWIARQTFMSYLFYVTLALISALYQQAASKAALTLAPQR